MNGTKLKKMVPAAIVILMALAIAGAFWMNGNTKKANPVKIEVSEEGNFAASYLEGYMLGKHLRVINLAFIMEEVSEKEMKRLEGYIDRALEDVSFQNVEKVYNYLSKITDEEIDFNYHEGVDQKAYLRGYLNQITFHGIQLMKTMGVISEEDYQDLIELDYLVFMNPTEENTMELMEAMGEIVTKAATGTKIHDKGGWPPFFFRIIGQIYCFF